MDSKLIGQRLSELRKDKPREDVAAALGITVSALGMYERGERVPRDEIKVKIAKYYGVSVQDLFFTIQ
jgi:transcriptional regulator with XRE-family HTH domain